MASRPDFPLSTADALRKNGWSTQAYRARREYGNGVHAVIYTDGLFRVAVNGELRHEATEPQHETLAWTVCCTAMEANEVAWSQPEYKAQFAKEDAQ